MDANEITDFLRQYTEALGAGLVGDGGTAAAACYALPALVVRDQVAAPYVDQGQLAADMESLAQRYAAGGLVNVQLEGTTVEPLTDVLTSVDVIWTFTDAENTGRHSESYRYIVRSTGDGPRIQVAADRSLPAG